MDLWVNQFDFQFLGIVLLRLLAACILGGIIGFEREYTRHTPAGFRTHILVSLGSCLVMLISQYAVVAYGEVIDIDPTRIGAQVVSGVGCLGAGAIIRHGISVRGLTTAASIWAVACIGLACGIGFYTGAIFATLFIWLVLMYLKLFKDRISYKSKDRYIEIETYDDIVLLLNSLNKLLQENNLSVKSIEVSDDTSGKKKVICQLLKTGAQFDSSQLAAKIMELEGVLKVKL